MLIGAHVPTMGDYRKMAAYAREVGCECVQVFSSSPRSYAVPPADERVLRRLDQARRAAGELAGGEGMVPHAPGGPCTPDLVPAFPRMLVHVGYLVNLASDNPEQLAKSRDSLAGELVRAHALGAAALNVHTGSSKLLARAEVPARIAATVVAARGLAGFEACAVPIVFEDTAGAGDTFGTTMAELGAILRELDAVGVPRAQAGICIDTCHAWAAGYDVSGEVGWSALLDEADRECGLDRLRWIHANDCKFGRGSRKDRHEWIGRGCIGPEGFRAMVRRPELAGVDVVVEMPGEMPEKDAVNVGLLKTWRDEG